MLVLYNAIEYAQWVARLTRNVEVVGSSSIKGPSCFLEQETLPVLLSTGWFLCANSATRAMHVLDKVDTALECNIKTC